MKNINKKISLLLSFLLFFSSIFTFSPKVNADTIKISDNIIITDPITNNVNYDTMENGEVFVDKSVSSGNITIDQHDFSTNDFIVQLTSLAKEIKEKEEPVDVMIALDTTMSTSNPLRGYTQGSTSLNGSIDDFIMSLNVFIDITMSSNAENRVGIICYGASNVFISGTSYRLGSAPVSMLLPLGHYTNTSWTNISPYIFTQGAGNPSNGTYQGGGKVAGKYLTWTESKIGKSELNYLPSSYQSTSWGWSGGGYTFRIESSDNLKKDNQNFEKTYNYGGFSGTATMNGIIQAKKYLLENKSSNAKTGMLIVLTDGEANTTNNNYIDSVDYTSTSVSNRQTQTAYNSTVGDTVIGVEVSSYINKQQYITNENFVIISTLAAAMQAKNEIKSQYKNTYFYTIGYLTISEYAQNVLNPQTITSNSKYYSSIINFFKTNGTFSNSYGTIKNTTNLTNYKYSDKYYYAENTDELKESFSDLFYTLKHFPTGDIIFTDTIDSNMIFSGIKGLIVDGRLYQPTNIEQSKNKTIYNFTSFSGLEISVTNNIVTWTIPQLYVSSKMVLVFEEKINPDITFTDSDFIKTMASNGRYNQNTGKLTFYSNNGCIVNFTVTKDNTFDDFTKTINKTSNNSGKDTFVLKSIKSGDNVVVQLGNNGKIEKTILKDITLSKIWKDNNNAYNSRPESISYTLKRDGIDYKTGTITSVNDWKTIISDLVVYKNDGTEYVYTITENTIDKYSAEYNGFTITNTLKEDKTLTITKIWNDENNSYGTRPNSINITIIQNGKDFKTVAIDTSDVVSNNSNKWQINVVVPKYDNNGVLYSYTIREDTTNVNLRYFYETPIYDQSKLTVTNTAQFIPTESNEHPEYKIIIHKDIVDKDNNIADSEDFEQVALDINDTYNFAITLKELNRIVTNTGTSLVESYNGYSGNIINGIVTNKGDLIFNLGENGSGKYEISENANQYFDFVDIEKLNDEFNTSGASFSKENGKYYITLSGITGQFEQISVKVTNQIKPDRPYNETEDKINLFS